MRCVAGIGGFGAGPRLPSALEKLQVAFGLSAFERDLLFLCAGIELDSTVAPLCAAARVIRRAPTRRSAWPGRAARRPLERLVAGRTATALATDRGRIGSSPDCFSVADRRARAPSPGRCGLSGRAAGRHDRAGRASDSRRPGPVSRDCRRVRGRRLVTVAKAPYRLPTIQLCGPDPSDRRAVAAAAAATIGLRVAVLPADLVPASPAELDALVRLWDARPRLAAPYC